MATAGGAKMEPASCAEQSRSRSALRCLRFGPPWERHSAGRGGVAGRRGGGGQGQRGDVVTSLRLPQPGCAPRSPGPWPAGRWAALGAPGGAVSSLEQAD